MTTAKRLLPPVPHPENLRKQAKARLAGLRRNSPATRLAEAQHLIAREYGYENWAALLAEVARRQESPTACYRRIRRHPIALPAEPESLEADSTVTRFFLVGTAAASIFAVVAGIGLSILIYLTQTGRSQYVMALLHKLL